MGLEVEQVNLKCHLERGNVVLWKGHTIWNQLTYNDSLIDVNLERPNYISQNSLPCSFPIRIAIRDILV